MNFSLSIITVILLCTSCTSIRYDNYRDLRDWETKYETSDFGEISKISHHIWVAPDDKIGEILAEKILSAQNRIDLNVYLLSDVELINAIILAHRNDIPVRIILEHSVYNSPVGNSSIFQRLKQEGISVVWADEVRQNFNHAKYILIDNEVYLGTSNFTTTSFTKNREFIIMTSDILILQFMERLFEADFYRFPFYGNQKNIYLSPIDARKKLEKNLNLSKKSVHIFAASLSDNSLLNILAKKSSEGLQVYVCLAYDTSLERQSLKQLFQKQHITFRQAKSPYVHAKTLLIDDEVLFIGSENFTQNSLDQNREIGLILKNSYYIKKYKETILKDCRDI